MLKPILRTVEFEVELEVAICNNFNSVNSEIHRMKNDENGALSQENFFSTKLLFFN